MGIFNEVLQSRAEQERNMTFRHPWFNVMYNWIIAVLIVCLAVSCVVWGVSIHEQRITEAKKVEEQAQEEAEAMRLAEEQNRKEAEAREEREKRLNSWSEAGARQLYGIRLFIEKYHYTEKDLETYLRCPWNRYIQNNKITDLAIIIYKPDQFLACSEKNEVLTEYKTLARKFFEAWETETELPCDSAYVFAELTPDGIFLTKEFGAGPYCRRWQA